MKFNYKYSTPNFSDRHGTEIDTILLHHTGGDAPGCMEWLCSNESKVSAHYVIVKNGDIYKLLQPEKCAWHAGRGAYDLNRDGTISEDEKHFNRRSIGIELESMGDQYTYIQKIACIELCINLMLDHIRIKHNKILGHKEIAPGRKWDPNNFNMEKFRNLIKTYWEI